VIFAIKDGSSDTYGTLELIKTFESEKSNPLRILSTVLNDFSRLEVAFDDSQPGSLSTAAQYLEVFVKIGLYVKKVLKIYLGFSTKPNPDTLDNLINELRTCFINYKKSGLN
jgi:hypothetical protein